MPPRDEHDAYRDPGPYHAVGPLDDVSDLIGGLRRRAALVLGLPLAVGALSTLFHTPAPVVYETHLTFAVDIPQSALVPGSDEGTSAKVGEALIDDIHRIVQGDVFAASVKARLPEGIDFGPGDGRSSLSADDRHRVADVTVGRALPADAPSEAVAALQAELGLVATAIVEELDENGGTWFSLLGADEVNLTIVDMPDPAQPLPPTLRQRVEIPLRIALAALIALGLALALHAFDERLYEARGVERRTGLPVLGRIPRRPRDERSGRGRGPVRVPVPIPSAGRDGGDDHDREGER